MTAFTCYSPAAARAEYIAAATPQQAAQKYRRLMWRMDKDVSVEVVASHVVNDKFVEGTRYVQSGNRRICRPV
jgi:hypothetical protein